MKYSDWEKLDRETQIHLAEYDDGDFRVLQTFESTEARRGKIERVNWSSCEELIAGRWEGFVSINSRA